MQRVGIMFNPDSDASIRLFEDLAGAAGARLLDVIRMPVRGGGEVDQAFATAKSKGVEGNRSLSGWWMCGGGRHKAIKRCIRFQVSRIVRLRRLNAWRQCQVTCQ